MYAWRARIGLINPTYRGKALAFWFKYAPDGVEIVPATIGFRAGQRDTFTSSFDRAEELAQELKEVGCNIVCVGGTPPFLLKGRDFERVWTARLSERIGLPVVTGMHADALALQAVGARKVAVGTYYGEELNRAIVDYFALFGIEGLDIGGFSLTGQGEGLYATPLRALDEVSYMQVYQFGKRGVRKLGTQVDALYLNGAGWDAAPAVDPLEQDLQTKVVFSQAAQMWLVYSKLQISNPVPSCGSLLRDGYEPSPSP